MTQQQPDQQQDPLEQAAAMLGKTGAQLKALFKPLFNQLFVEAVRESDMPGMMRDVARHVVDQAAGGAQGRPAQQPNIFQQATMAAQNAPLETAEPAAPTDPAMLFLQAAIKGINGSAASSPEGALTELEKSLSYVEKLYSLYQKAMSPFEDARRQGRADAVQTMLTRAKLGLDPMPPEEDGSPGAVAGRIRLVRP